MSVQPHEKGQGSYASTWLFLRHGESTANAARRLSGWEDVALTERGEAQARLAATDLAAHPLARVLTSDLRRAKHTAELCLAQWVELRQEAHPPIQIDSKLRERNLGEFQGQELDVLRASGETQLLLGWNTRPPGGESHSDLAARALPLLAQLPDIEGPTLLVAHGGLIRTLLGLLDDLPLEQIGKNRVANAVVIERTLSPGRWIELYEQYGVPSCA
jgi:broad specificity phosphatase PhoE